MALSDLWRASAAPAGDPWAGDSQASEAPRNETERAIKVQILFAGVSLLLLLMLGSILNGWGHFIGWAILTACCASLFGVTLGLLFGLPTTQRVEIGRPGDNQAAAAAGAAAGAAAIQPPPVGNQTTAELPKTPPPVAAAGPATMPYAESTSLEQVADWLTKIIIGVTLTQFASWQASFHQLSIDVTANLNNNSATLGRCRALFAAAARPLDAVAVTDRCSRLTGGAIPGGVLMLTFALLGFLVAYLWMRRYFIIEMVVATTAAISIIRARSKQEEQVQLVRLQASLAQERAMAATNLKAVQEKADAALQLAKRDADDARAKLEAASAASQDVSRLNLARSGGTLQEKADGDYGDAKAYAVGALTRAQQLLPTNDAAQAICSNLIAAIDGGVLPYPDDPWRDQFGKDPVDKASNVQLSATVNALASNPNLFEVTLTIEPLDLSAPTSLSGQKALFFLHPTFGRDPRSVSFGPDGRAVLPLIAYGAFTVGVLLENGTRLELNLAEVEGAPELFRIN